MKGRQNHEHNCKNGSSFSLFCTARNSGKLPFTAGENNSDCFWHKRLKNFEGISEKHNLVSKHEPDRQNWDRNRDLDLSQKIGIAIAILIVIWKRSAISIAITASRSPIFLSIFLHTDMVQSFWHLLCPNWSIIQGSTSLWKMYENGKIAVFERKWRRFRILPKV